MSPTIPVARPPGESLDPEAEGAVDSRGHRSTLPTLAISRHRARSNRLGIVLALLGGASATTTTFDFSSQVPSGSLVPSGSQAPSGSPCLSTTSPGWSTGGGGGSASPFAFTCVAEGATPSPNTGPSAGVGGNGTYFYAEANAPRAPGNYFTITYDGSACSDSAEGVSVVIFSYHMYGSNMGELLVTNAAGETVSSLSRDHPNPNPKP